MLPKQLTARFRRITTSGAYYPEIDGIRFLCIVMVMLCHVEIYVETYVTPVDASLPSPFLYLFQNGGLSGVFAFFTLSGYILSLPFLKAKFDNRNAPSLKKYFLRRLTRLEPPYIISLLLSFVMLVWVLGKFSFNELLPHFFASLFYVHHIFFPQVNPLTLPVAWSLEVEMMFYISLPFVLYALYKLPAVYRRLIMFAIILVIPFLSAGIFSNVRFLTPNIPYFLSGILIAEHVVQKENPLSFIPRLIKLPLLLALLFLYFMNNYPGFGLSYQKFNAVLLYAIFMLIVIDKTAYRFFANKYIATIGGMSYSLYLTHYAVISCMGRYVRHSFFGGNFIVNLLFYTVIFLVPVLLVGAIFYLLIEQPAMKKTWWKRSGNKVIAAAQPQD